VSEVGVGCPEADICDAELDYLTAKVASEGLGYLELKE
jgi:hypothetical protein